MVSMSIYVYDARLIGSDTEPGQLSRGWEAKTTSCKMLKESDSRETEDTDLNTQSLETILSLLTTSILLHN